MEQLEVITTDSKEQRDRLFEDLRKNGDSLERQVVKFSGCRPVLDEEGNQTGRIIRYSPTGRPQVRLQFVSTWSVAYPRTA